MVKVEVVMDEKSMLARHRLNLKLIKFSWALFFILIGGSWILESIGRINNSEKWAAIYAGSGGILIMLNFLRIIWKLGASKFTAGLGALLFITGLIDYYVPSGFSIWFSIAALLLIIGIFMLFEVIRK